MAINAGQVTLDEAATIDKRLQTVTRTITDTVHNEVMVIIDPDDADNNAFLRVKTTMPANSDYGAVVAPKLLNRDVSGTITADEGTVVTSVQGASVVGLQITGTWVATLMFEVTVNDTDWFAVTAVNLGNEQRGTSTSANNNFSVRVGGFSQFRVRADAFTSGTVQVDMHASAGNEVIDAVRLTDGIDTAGVNGAGELLVFASAQPGTDIGDVTVNNAAGASAVNVQDGGNSLTIDNATLSVTGGGVEASALRVTIANDSTGLVSVDDNAGSLTIDNATLSVTGGGVEASALRVTIANDSTGVVSVDDNAGSLTVDGTVTANAGTGFPPVVTDGSAAGTTGIHVLGTDGTNAQIISTNTTGHVNIADGGNVITVDGTVSSTQGTTPWTVQGQTAHDSPVTGDPLRVGGRASAAAPADVSADGDAVNAWFLRNGAQAAVITAAGALIGGDATNGLDVDVTRVTGTVNVQVAAETTNRVEVMGDVADDVAAAGNPLQMGAIARNADRTAVANADITYVLADLLGKQVVLPYAVPELFVSGLATLTSTSDTSVIAAGGAGVRNYVTSLSASNTSGTAVRVDFKDGTTTFISFFVAASGGGAAQSFPVPFRGTAATAVNAALSAAVTDVRVSAQGYRAAN